MNPTSPAEAVKTHHIRTRDDCCSMLLIQLARAKGIVVTTTGRSRRHLVFRCTDRDAGSLICQATGLCRTYDHKRLIALAEILKANGLAVPAALVSVLSTPETGQTPATTNAAAKPSDRNGSPILNGEGNHK